MIDLIILFVIIYVIVEVLTSTFFTTLVKWVIAGVVILLAAFFVYRVIRYFINRRKPAAATVAKPQVSMVGRWKGNGQTLYLNEDASFTFYVNADDYFSGYAEDVSTNNFKLTVVKYNKEYYNGDDKQIYLRYIPDTNCLMLSYTRDFSSDNYVFNRP